MLPLSSILVDVEALAGDQPALAQAGALARTCRARLTIVDVLPAVPASARAFVTPALEQEIVEHRTDRLRALAAASDGGPDTRTALLRGRPATALIEEVKAGGHGLLVRSHDRDLARPRRPYGAVDMELLRSCPCPVWLLGRRAEGHRPWRVAAAIQPSPEASDPQLTATILDWALLLRDVAGAEVTLLHAWAAYGAAVLRSRLPAQEFADYIEAARRTADDAMRAFTGAHAGRLAGVNVQLIEGEPDVAISEYVDAHGIDLVVIGTVARSGIPGLVMGNTAERVLQRLRGSVLAVKPPGFG
jgi:nucleotide-binding universal stress UspA family protein